MKNEGIKQELTEGKKPRCGIVMPISPMDNCSAEHWKEVKDILTDAIKSAEFEANLVSEADDSGIIQKRIVQNIYNNEIVICDVSCKNPNVMFELGMRLAFDKPTIIIMDDATKYSFDTAPIEHLSYPRDLSYYKIVEFKNKLKDKIIGTMDAAQDTNYTTFLKHFGEFKVASIEHKEGSLNDVILARLEDLSNQIANIRRSQTLALFPRVENDTQREIINNITRQEIDNYCLENDINENELYQKDEYSKDRIALFRYVMKNNDLRHLCGSPARIRKALDENLHPF